MARTDPSRGPGSATAPRIHKYASCAFACALAACSAASEGTQFIFSTSAVTDRPHLQMAERLASPCANLEVAFRLSVSPASAPAALPQAVAAMEAAGDRYYITAGSSDFTEQDLFWSPGTMCRYLRQGRHIEGLYLHEVLSAKNGSGHGFEASDWNTIGQYARCASRAHKKLIWSEWAGGRWGWSNFLAQTSARESLAHRVLSQYRNSFVFLWADNRDVRNPKQLSDMLLAERIVHNLGDPQNPLGYSFPHGMSIQDWQWFEMNRDAAGGITPSAGATLPSSLIGGFGITDYLNGGRFFEFETYWNNPRMFSGISQLQSYISRARNCPAPTSTRASVKRAVQGPPR